MHTPARFDARRAGVPVLEFLPGLGAFLKTIHVKAALLCVVLLSFLSASAHAEDTDLLAAVKDRNPQLVRALLKQGASANARHADGSTALAWAVHRGDLESIDLLLAAGADANLANELGVTPLWLACDGSATIVERLLKSRANPNVT